MKNLFWLAIPVALFCGLSCQDNNPANFESLDCDEYWSRVDLSSFCGIEVGVNLDTGGLPDFCDAESNAAYPHGERIFIDVDNFFTVEESSSEHERIKLEVSSDPGFELFPNLGDDGYGFRSLASDNMLSLLIINVLSGQYQIRIEVNFSNTAADCLTESMIYDMVDELIAAF